MTIEVEIVGLRALIRDLRRVEKGLPKAMRQVFLPISQEVLTQARRRAQSQGGVARHAVRRGLRGGATQSSAWIKLLAKEPTIHGAEFGGRGRPTTQQFQPWRGSGGGAGYFVYPTVRRMSGDIADEVEDSLNRLLRSAGL